MGHIWTITKKELRRFFTDPRMVISLILPGILIYLLYSMMGSLMFSQMEIPTDYEYKVVVIGEVVELSNPTFGNLDVRYLNYSFDEAKVLLENDEINLIVVYEDDFYNKYLEGEKPSVDFFYNSTDQPSSILYNNFTVYLDSNLSSYKIGQTDYADDNDISITLITSIVPLLLITFLLSGSMAITTESIAGEKERGTIATLLATPIKRHNISLGKIIALSIGALVSAISSFAGLMLSLPSLFGGMNVSFNMYGMAEYLLLFLVIVSTVLIFVGILALISAYAKSIKEATSLATPLIIVVMAAGVTSMIGAASTNYLLYLIPVYNSVQVITSVLSLNVNYLHFIITIISNMVYVVTCIYILTKMFNSEKYMFSK